MSTERVRVLSPWRTYRDWQAGKVMLPELLMILIENGGGLARIRAVLGSRREAERELEAVTRATDLLIRLCPIGETEMTPELALIVEEVERLIDQFRPAIHVGRPIVTRRRWWGDPEDDPTYRTYVLVDVRHEAASHCLYAERAGRPARKRDAVWEVRALEEWSYYHSDPLGMNRPYNVVQAHLTYRDALERAKRLAYAAA